VIGATGSLLVCPHQGIDRLLDEVLRNSVASRPGPKKYSWVASGTAVIGLTATALQAQPSDVRAAVITLRGASAWPTGSRPAALPIRALPTLELGFDQHTASAVRKPAHFQGQVSTRGKE